jgi:D-glycero-alpha-D-manno-heptose-7-phosphate kinase
MLRVTCPTRIDISAGWSDAAPFVNEFGGAVLNAAISRRVSATLTDGKLINSLDEVPGHSGLGTSGALRTAYLVAANPKLIENKIELVKRVHTFENAIVGQRAGYQDQAAAIFGGVNYWEFRKNGGIHREPLTKKEVKHLQDRLVLVHTGEGHISACVHEQVFEGRRFIKFIPQIDRMRVIAGLMKKHISNEKKMVELINETWGLQKKLHILMETQSMKKIQDYCKRNYLAARATGAGGGGCMIFYTRPEWKKALINEIHELERRIKNLEVLDFEFDYVGIELEKK